MANLILTTELTLKDAVTAYFYDRTGNNGDNAYFQGGNIDYAQVISIRLKTANYTTLSNASEPENNTFVQYLEYIKVSGAPETINGKTFVVGNVFVPQFANLTTIDSTTWNTTGYYVYPFLNGAWRPTSAEVPLEISVAKLNQEGDQISDNEYVDEYEVYNNDFSATTPAVVDTTYIVTGVAGDSVDYNGDTFYNGEIFTASDTSNIIPSGSAHFSTLYAATTSYATLVYKLTTDLNDLIERQIGLGTQDLVDTQYGQILKIRTYLESLQYSSKSNNVSLLYAYETIIELQTVVSSLINQTA